LDEFAFAPRQRDLADTVWRSVGRLIGAHVLMLRDAGVVDDKAATAALAPLDGIARGEPLAGELTAQILAFEDHLEALVAPNALGVSALGRGRAESAATIARLVVRDALVELLRATAELRTVLVELSDAHATTTMPFTGPYQTPQPTTFGHFLGGLSGPLERAVLRLEGAFDLVNLSPLGAVAGTSTALPISRERSAALLGFAGLVENTLDAVSATDHLSDAASAADAVAKVIGRFLDELLIWHRTEPGSLRLTDDWATTDPDFPGLRTPLGLERLVTLADAVGAGAEQARVVERRAGYATAASLLGLLLDAAFAAIVGATELCEATTRLLSSGLETNLAYLANRAGKGFTTASDLTTLLITEEGLDPVAAERVAALTISRARDEGLEISGVTSAMIDGAALLTIGRELGVEFELISRYLAPRRYLERRTATGGPALAAMRESLARARRRLDHDVARRRALEDRLAAADRELQRLVEEVIVARPEH
jgi:argininosuccinate lyase